MGAVAAAHRRRRGFAAAAALCGAMLCAVSAACDRSADSVSAPAALAPAAAREAEFEVVPPRVPARPAIDPAAAPQTPLGALRAGWLPLWSPAFDSAFPPEVCGSAWELDAIAEPTSGVAMSLYGDVAALAALAVMRYEHLWAAVTASPSRVGQLCVAVASVGETRTEALATLAVLLAQAEDESADDAGAAGVPPVSGVGADADEGALSAQAPAALRFPASVTVIAVAPTAALATACVAADADDAGESPGSAGVWLRAYELATARGIEDRVADVSYRVARTLSEPADDCSALPAWVQRWAAQVQAWLDEGRYWEPLGATVTADRLCASPSLRGVDECPYEWLPPLARAG
ncbi:MAG: hypothetical protein F4W98_03720 [Acidimicrobiales bacterium]|nr:hypothetical protein [Acidimicrobiales bacterium]